MNRTQSIACILLLLAGSCSAGSVAFLDTNPSSTVKSVGDTFSVGIELASASSPGVAGYDITVDFPTFLFANDVMDAGYFQSTGDTFFLAAPIDNVAGTLEVIAALNGTPPGDAGPDILFTIDFQALAPGSGAITIIPNQLLDSNGNGMTVGAQAGSVQVTEAAPTPEPSTFWMVAGAAMLGLGARVARSSAR